MKKDRGGYTLVELLIVIMIIGILSAYGVPQYLRSVETSKADDAVALVNMLGTTNRMFALDHNSTFAVGQFPNSSCGAGVCPQTPPYGACALVYCRYLADMDFSVKSYDGWVCGGGACGLGGGVSAVRRKAGSVSPYSGWGYTMSMAGRVTAYGGAPPPAY
ncbi:MAG: type II secretion system protein [Elusimicrobiota bacterium]